jgi:mannose-6-phosphate isomerase-like protein (cupin superfamily)
MSAPYTHVNLVDVEDSAPSFGLGHAQETRFAHESLELQRTGVTFLRFKPGARPGFAHRHEEAEEVYVVLSGSGRIKLDDEIVELTPRDAIRVAPTVTRSFEAGPDGLEVVAVGAHHPGDGEVFFEWWT